MQTDRIPSNVNNAFSLVPTTALTVTVGDRPASVPLAVVPTHVAPVVDTHDVDRHIASAAWMVAVGVMPEAPKFSPNTVSVVPPDGARFATTSNLVDCSSTLIFT